MPGWQRAQPGSALALQAPSGGLHVQVEQGMDGMGMDIRGSGPSSPPGVPQLGLKHALPEDNWATYITLPFPFPLLVT